MRTVIEVSEDHVEASAFVEEVRSAGEYRF
jgi:hypothetical protein